jgi:glucose-1-phosphate thymidylyltransferase
MNTLGIILAGGSGTRLFPMTKSVCKQLQPVYDKPMIYYPLASLISSGIKEILIISTPNDILLFQKLFSDGSNLGIKIYYTIQQKPSGIPEAFVLAEPYAKNKNICLILGDNIFHGETETLKRTLEDNPDLPTIFAYYVDDPKRYGVVQFDKDKNILSIEEKPNKPKSNYSIPGLYVYPNDVIDLAKTLKPSKRGELEIVDIHKHYAFEHTTKLNVEILSRGICWFDAGTPESLLEASQYVHAIEKRQGKKIGCIEEISWEIGNLTDEEFQMLINNLPNSSYKSYLSKIISSDYSLSL